MQSADSAEWLARWPGSVGARAFGKVGVAGGGRRLRPRRPAGHRSGGGGGGGGGGGEKKERV